MMTTKTYYIQNTSDLDVALAKISNTYPSAIQREFIEMDYSEIEITVRTIDVKSIEKLLAPLV